ncbi:hypothetical protein C8R45DRAFT_299982 [Mycena sanguinolenta]|nr:hypothetical protein C8R45DRAFT_299982 [Mycena sanguinolenta]
MSTPCPVNEPRLPPEIVDQILRKLDPVGAKHTLCTCALVSRTWLALSRPILFRSIFITAFRITVNNDTLDLVKRGTTIRPYVRDIGLCLPPTSEWTQADVFKLLAKFPECTTLRLTDRWEIIRQLEFYAELERLLHEPAPQSSFLAKLRRAFGSSLFGRRRKPPPDSSATSAADDDTPPTPDLNPLARLHTLYMDWPRGNLPLLRLLAPTSLHTLDLTLTSSPTPLTPPQRHCTRLSAPQAPTLCAPLCCGSHRTSALGDRPRLSHCRVFEHSIFTLNLRRHACLTRHLCEPSSQPLRIY